MSSWSNELPIIPSGNDTTVQPVLSEKSDLVVSCNPKGSFKVTVAGLYNPTDDPDEPLGDEPYSKCVFGLLPYSSSFEVFNSNKLIETVVAFEQDAERMGWSKDQIQGPLTAALNTIKIFGPDMEPGDVFSTISFDMNHTRVDIGRTYGEYSEIMPWAIILTKTDDMPLTEKKKKKGFDGSQFDSVWRGYLSNLDVRDRPKRRKLVNGQKSSVSSRGTSFLENVIVSEDCNARNDGDGNDLRISKLEFVSPWTSRSGSKECIIRFAQSPTSPEVEGLEGGSTKSEYPEKMSDFAEKAIDRFGKDLKNLSGSVQSLLDKGSSNIRFLYRTSNGYCVELDEQTMDDDAEWDARFIDLESDLAQPCVQSE